MKNCDKCNCQTNEMACVYMDVNKYKCPKCKSLFYTKLFPWEIPIYVGIDGPFFDPNYIINIKKFEEI